MSVFYLTISICLATIILVVLYVLYAQAEDRKNQLELDELSVESNLDAALKLASQDNWKRAIYFYRLFLKENYLKLGKQISKDDLCEERCQRQIGHRLKIQERDLQIKKDFERIIQDGLELEDIVKMYFDGQEREAYQLFKKIYQTDPSFDPKFEFNKHLLDSAWELIFVGIIEQHINTLVKKRTISIKVDDYGNTDKSSWIKEVDYFIDNVLLKNINLTFAFISEHSQIKDDLFWKVFSHIEERIQETAIDFDDNMDPLDYEHYCLNILSKSGWNAKLTPSSGDQGVDIIANNNGIKLAVQCKLYSQPVGNKAVQEIYAGTGFEDANIAAVVCNNSFTKSAVQLANKLNVSLLHHTELGNFLENQET